MDNPDLVEEYPRDFKMTQFEKIIVAAKRAKDLHNHDKAAMVDSQRKIPYVALEELRQDEIKAIYREEEKVELLAEDSEDEEDE